jgi:hypothetical protein
MNRVLDTEPVVAASAYKIQLPASIVARTREEAFWASDIVKMSEGRVKYYQRLRASIVRIKEMEARRVKRNRS